MTEIKVVIEDLRSEIRKMIEMVSSNFYQVRDEIRTLKQHVSEMENRVDALQSEIHTIKEQVGLLHEKQTEIHDELKQKIDRNEFASLRPG